MQLKRTANHPGQLSLPLFDLPSLSSAEPALPLIPVAKPFTDGFPSPPRSLWGTIAQALQPTFAQSTPTTPTTPTKSTPTPQSPKQDQRLAVLLGEKITYQLRRSARKTIGFQIGEEGLVITAPRWVRLADVDEAMQDKARWILTKLNEQRERRAELVQRRVDWRDGATLPFMGTDITMRLDSTAGGEVFDAALKTLRIALPQQAEPQQIKDRAQAWLQRQAKLVFDERVAYFAQRLQVQVSVVKLSNANTRWGTAGIEGDIRLNWRLIHFALPVIDYVAAHEVAHLREMNHGPAFWATVKSIFPEFEAAKAQLRDEKLPQLG
jgi:predicted metal-dependent hydrolase